MNMDLLQDRNSHCRYNYRKNRPGGTRPSPRSTDESSSDHKMNYNRSRCSRWKDSDRWYLCRKQMQYLCSPQCRRRQCLRTVVVAAKRKRQSEFELCHSQQERRHATIDSSTLKQGMMVASEIMVPATSNPDTFHALLVAKNPFPALPRIMKAQPRVLS